MRKTWCSGFLLVFAALFFAPSANGNRLVNVNPDPDGEPWIAGGITKEQWDSSLSDGVEFKAYKGLSKRAALPVSVNNTLHQAFRPVFNQKGGSCAQASAVGYVYAYEINCQRGLPSNVLQNQYPYDFTYNFLNAGSGSRGSNSTSGWSIIRDLGIPNAEVYGGFGLGLFSTWVSGYGVYRSGMENRLKEYFNITIRTGADVEQMKQWLFDRGNGSPEGGCLVFGADATGEQIITLATGTPEGGKRALVKFGTGGGHAMTIAGYNDEVRYDYNNDGAYTNDIDLNGDGVINVQDWEIGAVLMVNSWGSRWGNNGMAYLMYKVLADPDDNGGIYNNRVSGIYLHDDPVVNTRLALKVELSHTVRCSLRIRAGFSNNISASVPSETKSYSNAFNYSGGIFPMQGTTSDPIEIGLDISDLLGKMTGPEAAFFLRVDSRGGTGTINSLSMIDYTGGQPVEYPCSQTNVSIPIGTTYLKIVRPAAPILLVTPNSGERWERGRAFNISWVANIEDNIKIELLKGNTVTSVIAESVPNSGSYQWQIPEDFATGSDYAVRISGVSNSTRTDKSDGVFSILEKSILELTSPDGGEVYESGSSVDISWNDNTASTVKLDLYKGGILAQTIADNVSSGGLYNWTIPDNIASGFDYKIRVVTKMMEWRFDESDADFIISKPKAIAPYVQSFDLFRNGDTLTDSWEQDSDDDLDWLILNGPTPSKVHPQGGGTGPSSDHTSGSGKYIYVEASSPNNPEKSATLLSPLIDVRQAADKIVSFWLHMFSSGNHMGNLAVDVNVNGTWHENMLNLTGNHGDSWILQTIDLNSLNPEYVQVRFRALTGTDYDSDICVDDFRVGSDQTFSGTHSKIRSGKISITDRFVIFDNAVKNAKVLSLNGVVITERLNIRNGSSMDISGLPSGIYLLKTNSGSVRFFKSSQR